MKILQALQKFRNILFCCLSFLYLSSIFASKIETSFYYDTEGFMAVFVPDTIPPDSIDEISVTAVYDFSDTAEIYVDGLDSIFLLQEDTSIYTAQFDSSRTYYLGDAMESVQFEKPNESLGYYFATDTAAYYIPENETIPYQLIDVDENNENTQNSTELQLSLVEVNHTIEISPFSDAQEFDPGLFGTNIAGMFGQKQEPEGYYGEDQWQILSDLSPNVIRFASGAPGLLMHLLHDPTTDAKSQGYGYVLDEIVHYFDNTDGEEAEIDGIDPDWDLATGSILIWTENDKEDAIDQWLLDGWIEDEKRAGNCFDYVQQYKNQQLLPSGTSYIDAFIRLIQFIENDESNGNNERGLRVKVIVNLNIVSETVDENKAIIDYLRDETLNGIYSVDVYGVEMGNECYDAFYQLCMGFTSFQLYYDYLTGNDAPAFSSVLRTEMLGSGHALLQGFRTDPDFAFSIKVGVVGYDAPDPTDNSYQLRKIGPDDEITYPEWNYDLATNYYDEDFLVDGGIITVPAFDAVIIHPYFGKENFQDEIIGETDPALLKQKYNCGSASGGVWNFTSYDSRLKPAFDFMTKKFLTLFKTGYEESFYRWGEDLGFISENDYGGKELWITEWNFKDAGDYPEDNDVYRMTAFENTFLQGLFVFEFDLKNIKINYDNDFWSPFMPITAFHNFGGGGNSELVNFCLDEELVYYYNNPEDWMTTSKLCNTALYSAATSTDGLIRHYYTKHTPYFATELISDIYKNNLQLLRCNFTMPFPLAGKLYNLKPTVFIDENQEYMYIYYSNAWGYDQNFAIDPSGLVDFFEDAIGVELGAPFIYGLDADFPYSTAGRCSLYDYRFNTCYSNPGGPNSCTDAMPSVPFPIHLTDVDEIDALADGCESEVLSTNCITVPPYSFGYIKLELLPFYEKQSAMTEFKSSTTLFPNPATDYFTFNIMNCPLDNKIIVQIYNLQGILLKDYETTNQQNLNVSDLPSGCYLVRIHPENSVSSTQMLIKN